jgi:hypothetical protein
VLVHVDDKAPSGNARFARTGKERRSVAVVILLPYVGSQPGMECTVFETSGVRAVRRSRQSHAIRNRQKVAHFVAVIVQRSAAWCQGNFFSIYNSIILPVVALLIRLRRIARVGSILTPESPLSGCIGCCLSGATRVIMRLEHVNINFGEVRYCLAFGRWNHDDKYLVG